MTKRRQLVVVGSRFIEHDVRTDMFRQSLSLDGYYYGKNRIGDLINRLPRLTK